MEEDLDHAASLERIAALIAEKRRVRVQVALGKIDTNAASERVGSVDAELAKQWESLRRSQIRAISDQTASM